MEILNTDGLVRASSVGILADGTDQTNNINAILSLPNVFAIHFDTFGSDIMVAGTVTVPSEKILAFRNNCRLVGMGRIDGGLIDCNIRKQCFGTDLEVINLVNDDISVMWFGAKPDYIPRATTWTDNTLPITKAIKARINIDDGVSYSYKTKVYIPANTPALNPNLEPKYYYCNSTVVMDACMELYGSGMDRTILKFPSGVLGIHMKTTVKNVSYGGRLQRLADMSLYGSAPYTFDDPNAHGVLIATNYSDVSGVLCQNFNGNGFLVQGNVPSGNANNCRITSCRGVGNGGSGLLLDGTDANNVTVSCFDGFANGRWGIWESSFLGNTFLGCHTAANGRENQYNLTAVTNQPFGTGLWKRYYCIKDCTGIEPGVSANWQNYWEYYNDITSGPNYDSDAQSFKGPWKKWDATTTFKTGGGYYADDGNQNGTFLSCYAEQGDQHQVTNLGNSQFIGGFASVYGTFKGAQGMQNGSITVSRWQAVNPAGERPNALTAFSVDHTVDGTYWGGIDRTNSRGFGFFSNYDGTTNFASNTRGLNPSFQAITSIAVPAYAARIGRSAIPANGVVGYPLGIWIGRDGNLTKYRFIGAGSAMPVSTTQEYSEGDILINSSSTDTNTIMWKCLTGGKPGKWVAYSNFMPSVALNGVSDYSDRCFIG
jgi:hypothetical protein